MKTKRCSCCQEAKPVSEFYKDASKPDELEYRCKECCSKYCKQYYQKNRKQIQKRARQWQRENPGVRAKIHRENQLKRKYGLTPEDYDQMLADQNGCCAICGGRQSKSNRRLAVDHDKETKRVRGLLCVSCNRGIGYLQHNTDILRNAVAYLEETRAS